MAANRLFLAGVVAVLLGASTVWADALGPEDEACLSLREGDTCNERNAEQGGPGFQGACVRYDFGEGRARLRCRPPGPPLTDVQESCIQTRVGEECTRPSGATGRCVQATTRAVPGFGGKGTVELPMLECVYSKPDKSRGSTTAAIGLGVTAVAILGVVVFLRRRSARRKADEEAKSRG